MSCIHISELFDNDSKVDSLKRSSSVKHNSGVVLNKKKYIFDRNLDNILQKAF